jgi:hypothetical protein
MNKGVKIMPRKVSALLNTWLRPIAIANQDYDELTTVNVVKTMGRMLVGRKEHV